MPQLDFLVVSLARTDLILDVIIKVFKLSFLASNVDSQTRIKCRNDTFGFSKFGKYQVGLPPTPFTPILTSGSSCHSEIGFGFR